MVLACCGDGFRERAGWFSGSEQGGGIFSVGPPGLLVNAIAPPAANPNVFSNTPDNIDILNVPCG